MNDEMKIRDGIHREPLDLFRRDHPLSLPPLVFDSQSLLNCDRIWVAEINGNIAGCVAFNTTCYEAEDDDSISHTTSSLELIYVAKAYRKTNVATSLCSGAIEHLIEADRFPIYCNVSSLGMQRVIEKLSTTLTIHLTCVYSHKEYGDEWATRDW